MGNRFQSFERSCVNCAANCAKTTGGGGSVDDFVEERLTCDPAGAIFEETLEELNDIDRQLLFFCAGANLAAVRWLFVLGADKLAVDLNGTSALHTACRTGTLPVVKELMRKSVPLDIMDASGWTPLHIAIFMCRRDLILTLLRARAPLQARSSKGLTPLDMCTDSWTREAIEAFKQHRRASPDLPWTFEREHEARQDTVASSRLQYEPFFVPRTPVIDEYTHKQEFNSLSVAFFNKKPGHGLAFLVASGATRDFPVDLSAFLRRGKLDLAQIGSFLGESFSLSQTLRLEFINSVKFHGTSIVSSMAKVFTLLQIPQDLQKIDRLVHGVARIWWRQHDKICEDHEDSAPGRVDMALDVNHETGCEAELESFELKQYLTGPETLYQIMFSVVMLHWNLYAPSMDNGEDGRISMQQWLDINRGLESDGSEVPLHILQRTYHTVRNGFIPQLAVRRPPRAVTNWDGEPSSLLKPLAKIEGWSWIRGQSFVNSVIAGQTRGSNVSSIFSENLARIVRDAPSARGASGAPLRSEATLAVPTSWDSKNDEDRVWLSLCHGLLFLSASQSLDEVPYAFVHLRSVAMERVEQDLVSLTLVSISLKEQDLDQGGARLGGSKTVVVVFLLPDGRWQEFELPTLEIQLSDQRQLESWVSELRKFCGDSAGGTL